jgi:hypothetical protein
VNKLWLNVLASILCSAPAVAQEPSDWYQDLLRHKSPPGLLWQRFEPPVVPAGAPPSGHVYLDGGSVGAGIGHIWGHGTLHYGDRTYEIRLSGVSLVDVGAAKISTLGEVYNLTQLEDFPGHYSAVTAGLTIAGGGSVAYLKNANGVVIRLHSSAIGMRFNLSVEGINIRLDGNR